ncbi:MAG: Wzy polymerase domain-containing protein [Rhodoferax sp.]
MKYTPGFALLFASWLQPLHLLPWVSWHSEVLAFSAVLWLFFVELLGQKNTGTPLFVLPLAAVAPLALAVLTLIQFLGGLIPFFGDALIICFYMVLCSMTIVVGYAWGVRGLHVERTSNSMSLLSQLAVVVLVGVLASVFIALVQSFQVWDSVDWILYSRDFRRPGANIGQPNQFATFLLMGLASLVFLFESKRVSAPLATCLIAVLALGLAISESRAGLLGAVLLSAWWVIKHRAIGFKLTAASLLMGWMAFLLLAWAWPVFITYVQSGGGDNLHLSVGVDRPSGLRLIVWPQLIEAAMTRPWFGWGLREVSTAHNAVLHHYQHGEPYTYAHNLILELAIGVGLPMTVLMVGLFSYWGWHRMRAASSLVQWYCIALLIPFGVHSMLEFPFAYAYLLASVMLALGVLEANFAPHRVLRWRLGFTAFGAAVLSTLMAWSVVEYVAIEEDFRVARFEAQRIGKTASQYQRPVIHLLTQLDGLLVAMRAVPSPDMAPAQIELLRNAAMRFPWTTIQNRYALSLALNGNPDEAVRQLQVMRAAHGEKMYRGIRESWEELARSKYPQLGQLPLP